MNTKRLLIGGFERVLVRPCFIKEGNEQVMSIDLKLILRVLNDLRGSVDVVEGKKRISNEEKLLFH